MSKEAKLTPLWKIADEINREVLKIEHQLPQGHKLRDELHWTALKAQHLSHRLREEGLD